ncbi:hypothetical protein Poli38472_000016 [Pythium oligandrum]|uniref:Ubiquitin-like 1-activating enzyme E1A n=1 Tax=Pythium oligandrum TaxID=41045 RepID=A0A8K1CBG1_PYTOL|nr:hypothetical protein Poli38472_000016 [Pythium oligandrum]|eukprot:TMW59974.1 hypothetical protein Poli38472_000016 [Pythium oligandrum]
MVTAMEVETTFSAAEAAVYDRQMRLWGVEAQKRLQNSHVLISGLTVLGAELVKNLVLSGMNVTVHDTTQVTDATVATQFFFDAADIGQNRAEASLAKVRDLNPLVRVQSETTPLDQLPDTFVEQFTLVCLIGASEATELRFDALCRAHNIAFLTAHAFGFEGIMFADLGHHTYRRTPVGENAQPSDPITVEFPSLNATHDVQWSSLQNTRKRGPQMPRVFVKHQLLQGFRSAQQLAIITSEHTDSFVAYATEQLQKHGLAAEFFSLEELRGLVQVAQVDLAPVCAILAGILGQEVIKAVSQKDEPICNYFYFDGAAGIVRRIG